MTIKFEGPPENESECNKLEKEYLELERLIGDPIDGDKVVKMCER